MWGSRCVVRPLDDGLPQGGVEREPLGPRVPLEERPNALGKPHRPRCRSARLDRIRAASDSPMTRAFSGWLSSSTITAKGSAKTVAASTNVTRCFRAFSSALRPSHANRTA